MYENHLIKDKRVGSLEYPVSTVAGLTETRLGQFQLSMDLSVALCLPY